MKKLYILIAGILLVIIIVGFIAFGITKQVVKNVIKEDVERFTREVIEKEEGGLTRDEIDRRVQEEIEIPDEVLKLVEKRNQARIDKNWGKADDLRRKINKLGFRIDDTIEGSKIYNIE